MVADQILWWLLQGEIGSTLPDGTVKLGGETSRMAVSAPELPSYRGHRHPAETRSGPWCSKFGPSYAAGLPRRRAHPSDKWHPDEVQLKGQFVELRVRRPFRFLNLTVPRGLPRRREVLEHHLPLDGCAQRARPVLCRRRAHRPRSDASASERFHARSPRRHPGGLQCEHRDQSGRLRRQLQRPIPGADNATDLSDKVALTLEVEAVLQGDKSAE
jgi:hypothetical protein